MIFGVHLQFSAWQREAPLGGNRVGGILKQLRLSYNYLLSDFYHFTVGLGNRAHF